jgi:hypothetical protein
MNRRAMVDRLAEAELDSARFNARRTTTARDETVIRRITDSDRFPTP